MVRKREDSQLLELFTKKGDSQGQFWKALKGAIV